MKLFKNDPAAALDAERSALLQIESHVIRLQNDRAVLIESEGDIVAPVLKLDSEIEKQRQAAVIRRDRIAALERQCREHERQRLQREKAAGIAEVGKRLAKRLEAAHKLDAAHKKFAEAFAELLKADDEAFNLPASVSPLGGLAHFHLEAFEPLSARIRPRRSAGEVRALAEHAPFNLGEAIEARNREVIEMLEAAPIAEIGEAA